VAIDREKIQLAAQKHVEKRRFDKAIEEYQRIVAEDPNDARTLLKIGDLYLKLEQYPQSIATYERVGQYYSLQGFALKAIAVYKQIREIIHKHVPHLEDRFGHIVPRLAEIYTQLGLTSDALAAYDEVATRLQRAGRDRDAIDIFRKIVDLDPNNPLPHLRLAEAFVRVRDLDNAIARFGNASDLLLKLGRRDDAIKVLERLLQHRTDPRFARAAAEVYLDRAQGNDVMSALTKLQIAFKENAKDLDTLTLLARAFDLLGQPTKAVEVLKEAARVAWEVGQRDSFQGYVDALVLRAPGDPGVAQLIAQGRNGPSSTVTQSEAPRPAASIPPEDVSVEELAENEAHSAAPFALKSAQPPAFDPRDPVARARGALAQAESLRRGHAYQQAVDTLVDVLAELPGAREVREKLCDILIEAGDQPGAVHQMLEHARYLASLRDVAGAARVLDEVLLLDPAQADALGMLQALGYTVPQPVSGHAESGGYPAGYAESVQPPYEPNAPLPSYDLEEIGAAQAMSQKAPRGASPVSVGHLDDPFAEQPLPSFPMEEDERPTAYMQVDAALAAVASPSSPEIIAPPAEHLIPAPTPSRRSMEALDEDALDEVEFFAHNGMFEEARNILEEQLARLPGHPLLLEKLREVELMSTGQFPAMGTIPDEMLEAPAEDDDAIFNIAASLDALDAISPEGAGHGHGEPHHDVSVEAVFEQFKAGVAMQISQSDAATHYDLGVAYKEMGLVTDAISEFELASRDAERECVCQSMIGMLHMELGNVDAAIDAFIRGLHATVRTQDQELALTYEIGNSYEARQNVEQALYYFQRVARIDPSYRDPRGLVEQRIARLAPQPKAQPARAVGAELALDDFDAAFDDLLQHGKLP
jgi:tetratricopeptide (TPR) repeat protein